MEVLSQVSCEAYRNVVRGEEKFVPASVVSDTWTELGKLPLVLALRSVTRMAA